MAKYSFDFKRKAVQEYLDGKGGYKYLSEKICHFTNTHIFNLFIVCHFICSPSQST